MAFIVELNKENFKFSGTHFTIFDAAHAERLHGHNYYVSVQLEVRELQKDIGLVFDFNLIKPVIKDLCADWDERVLIPQNSPFLKVKKSVESYDVYFNKKHYVFPADDVVILPIANVTVEELSRLICTRLVSSLKSLARFPFPQLNWVSIGVEETLGQRVIYIARGDELKTLSSVRGN